MISKEIKYGTSAERKPPAQGHPELFSKSSKSTLLPPILSPHSSQGKPLGHPSVHKPHNAFFPSTGETQNSTSNNPLRHHPLPFPVFCQELSATCSRPLCILILILPSKQSTYGLSLTTLCPPNYLFSQLRNPACFESFPRLIKELKLFSYSVWVWKSQKLLLLFFIISPPSFYKSHLCPYKMFILNLF